MTTAMVDASASPAPSLRPAPVSVRDWREDDEAAWDAFVLEQPRATFFHQIGWKRVLETTFGYPARYLVAERGGEMCGILPMFACRSIRGSLRARWRSYASTAAIRRALTSR